MYFKQKCIKCKKDFYSQKRSARRCSTCYKIWHKEQRKYKKKVNKRVKKGQSIGWGW